MLTISQIRLTSPELSLTILDLPETEVHVGDAVFVRNDNSPYTCSALLRFILGTCGWGLDPTYPRLWGRHVLEEIQTWLDEHLPRGTNPNRLLSDCRGDEIDHLEGALVDRILHDNLDWHYGCGEFFWCKVGNDTILSVSKTQIRSVPDGGYGGSRDLGIDASVCEQCYQSVRRRVLLRAVKKC